MGWEWARVVVIIMGTCLGCWGWADEHGKSAPVRPEDAGLKAPLVYLYANKENDFVRSQAAVISALKDCFDVRPLDLGAVADLGKTLEELHFRSDTPTFISGSHGWGHDGQQAGQFSDYAIDPKSGHNFRMAPILEVLDVRYPVGPKFVDLCGAGICEGKAKCLALGCEASQRVSVSRVSQMSALEEEMVPLFCDSAKACEKIKAIDKNNNNAADGDEIANYLMAKHGSRRRHVKWQSYENLGEARKLEEECRGLSGEFSLLESQKNLIRIRAEGKGKTGEVVLSDPSSISFFRRRLGESNLDGDLTLRLMKPTNSIIKGKNFFRSVLSSVDGFNRLEIKTLEPKSADRPEVLVTLRTPGGDEREEEWTIRTFWEARPLFEATCRWGKLVPVLRTTGGEDQTPIFGDEFQIKCLKPK